MDYERVDMSEIQMVADEHSNNLFASHTPIKLCSHVKVLSGTGSIRPSLCSSLRVSVPTDVLAPGETSNFFAPFT